MGSPLEFGFLRVQGSGTNNFCNSKLSRSFNTENDNNQFLTACLLNARGHMVDRIGVAMIPSLETAFMMTSPGHAARKLLNRLDPFVFPMDQVELSMAAKETFVFTLASTRKENLQKTFETFMLPTLKTHEAFKSARLPANAGCVFIKDDDDNNNNNKGSLLIVPTSQLPNCVGPGYTFCFMDEMASTGQQIWDYLVSEDNEKGPIEVGPLEFQTLQIESGQPAYGHEMTGHDSKKDKKNDEMTPASPLELHLQSLIDLEKGCYLGQEGVASITKNPRGPPRSLYHVVFDDEFNMYQGEEEDYGDDDDDFVDFSDLNDGANDSECDNLTRVPLAGDKLYVLGSNQEIAVGTLTSVGESGGTGDACTVGMALIRRSDSILKQMKSKGIVMDDVFNREKNDDILDGRKPRELFQDPLDGLEVIVEDTFTVGRLQTVASRRFGAMNMFDDEILYEWADSPEVDTAVNNAEDTSTAISDAEAAAQAKQAELEAAEMDAETQRKAEKLELLRKRAEEAMARRKAKQ
jgi:glycine cleavage system aminomethyltransferase T